MYSVLLYRMKSNIYKQLLKWDSEGGGNAKIRCSPPSLGDTTTLHSAHERFVRMFQEKYTEFLLTVHLMIPFFPFVIYSSVFYLFFCSFCFKLSSINHCVITDVCAISKSISWSHSLRQEVKRWSEGRLVKNECLSASEIRRHYQRTSLSNM